MKLSFRPGTNLYSSYAGQPLSWECSLHELTGPLNSEPRLNKGTGAVLHMPLVSESVKPSNVRVSPEPSHLALRVTACFFGRILNGFLKRHHAVDVGESLLVSERPVRTHMARHSPLEKRAGLLNKAGTKDGLRPGADSSMERLARGVEANTGDSESLEGRTTLLPQFRHGFPGLQTYLDGTNELGRVVGVDLLRRSLIEPL